jgi:hypothetical protein
VEITATETVPYANDPKITFPNLDTAKMGCKLIDTCVLYIDMRRSTELNLRLRPQTVAKLYSAFVRTMTRCARYYGGHVRGIIGDRVMVLFDVDGAFNSAMECAVLMNSAAKYVLNKHFKAGEVTFGIGIDSGKMLCTKTGIRKNGNETQNYRNLVWIGRPANIASKLTDMANKDAEWTTHTKVHVAYGSPVNDTNTWAWAVQPASDFVKRLEGGRYPDRLIKHESAVYASHFCLDHPVQTRPAAPAILMTERFWNGYRSAQPNDDIVTKEWVKRVNLTVPGYGGSIYGGDVVKTAFKPS